MTLEEILSQSEESIRTGTIDRVFSMSKIRHAKTKYKQGCICSYCKLKYKVTRQFDDIHHMQEEYGFKKIIPRNLLTSKLYL